MKITPLSVVTVRGMHATLWRWQQMPRDRYIRCPARYEAVSLRENRSASLACSIQRIIRFIRFRYVRIPTCTRAHAVSHVGLSTYTPTPVHHKPHTRRKNRFAARVANKDIPASSPQVARFRYSLKSFTQINSKHARQLLHTEGRSKRDHCETRKLLSSIPFDDSPYVDRSRLTELSVLHGASR